MADTIAIAIGRGLNSTSESSRVGTVQAEARANTFWTFTTNVVERDGSARLRVDRSFGPEEDRRTLVALEINSEADPNPRVTVHLDESFVSEGAVVRDGRWSETWTAPGPSRTPARGELSV